MDIHKEECSQCAIPINDKYARYIANGDILGIEGYNIKITYIAGKFRCDSGNIDSDFIRGELIEGKVKIIGNVFN